MQRHKQRGRIHPIHPQRREFGPVKAKPGALIKPDGGGVPSTHGKLQHRHTRSRMEDGSIDQCSAEPLAGSLGAHIHPPEMANMPPLVQGIILICQHAQKAPGPILGGKDGRESQRRAEPGERLVRNVLEGNSEGSGRDAQPLQPQFPKRLSILCRELPDGHGQAQAFSMVRSGASGFFIPTM